MAALEGRWDDARAGLLDAETVLAAVGEALMLARFRLALGHLAAGRFPEAAIAAEQAEQWFAQLGAPTYVASYRAAAAPGPAGDSPTGAATPARDAPATPATPVRSGG